MGVFGTWSTKAMAMTRGKGGEGGVLILVDTLVVRALASDPYKAGTEHTGFSPDHALTSPRGRRGGTGEAGRYFLDAD